MIIEVVVLINDDDIGHSVDGVTDDDIDYSVGDDIDYGDDIGYSVDDIDDISNSSW